MQKLLDLNNYTNKLQIRRDMKKKTKQTWSLSEFHSPFNQLLKENKADNNGGNESSVCKKNGNEKPNIFSTNAPNKVINYQVITKEESTTKIVEENEKNITIQQNITNINNITIFNPNREKQYKNYQRCNYQSYNQRFNNKYPPFNCYNFGFNEQFKNNYYPSKSYKIIEKKVAETLPEISLSYEQRENVLKILHQFFPQEYAFLKFLEWNNIEFMLFGGFPRDTYYINPQKLPSDIDVVVKMHLWELEKICAQNSIFLTKEGKVYRAYYIPSKVTLKIDFTLIGDNQTFASSVEESDFDINALLMSITQDNIKIFTPFKKEELETHLKNKEFSAIKRLNANNIFEQDLTRCFRAIRLMIDGWKMDEETAKQFLEVKKTYFTVKSDQMGKDYKIRSVLAGSGAFYQDAQKLRSQLWHVMLAKFFLCGKAGKVLEWFKKNTNDNSEDTIPNACIFTALFPDTNLDDNLLTAGFGEIDNDMELRNNQKQATLFLYSLFLLKRVQFLCAENKPLLSLEEAIDRTVNDQTVIFFTAIDPYVMKQKLHEIYSQLFNKLANSQLSEQSIVKFLLEAAKGKVEKFKEKSVEQKIQKIDGEVLVAITPQNVGLKNQEMPKKIENNDNNKIDDVKRFDKEEEISKVIFTEKNEQIILSPKVNNDEEKESIINSSISKMPGNNEANEKQNSNGEICVFPKQNLQKKNKKNKKNKKRRQKNKIKHPINANKKREEQQKITPIMLKNKSKKIDDKKILSCNSLPKNNAPTTSAVGYAAWKEKIALKHSDFKYKLSSLKPEDQEKFLREEVKEIEFLIKKIQDFEKYNLLIKNYSNLSQNNSADLLLNSLAEDLGMHSLEAITKILILNDILLFCATSGQPFCKELKEKIGKLKMQENIIKIMENFHKLTLYPDFKYLLANILFCVKEEGILSGNNYAATKNSNFKITYKFFPCSENPLLHCVSTQIKKMHKTSPVCHLNDETVKKCKKNSPEVTQKCSELIQFLGKVLTHKMDNKRKFSTNDANALLLLILMASNLPNSKNELGSEIKKKTYNLVNSFFNKNNFKHDNQFMKIEKQMKNFKVE